MGRYNVQFKAFKTGEWYVKTSTDFINSAYSVAYTSNYGRHIESLTQKQIQSWQRKKKKLAQQKRVKVIVNTRTF